MLCDLIVNFLLNELEIMLSFITVVCKINCLLSFDESLHRIKASKGKVNPKVADKKIKPDNKLYDGCTKIDR